MVQHIILNEVNNIKTSQIAFSDNEGVGDFYIAEADNSGMSGLSKPDNFSGICEQIKITSFDNWAREMAIGEIDAIKIDVEGAELAVLFGMLNTIQLHKPILALEIISENLRRFDQVPGQIYDFLSAYSYVPYRPVGDHSWELVDFGSEGDLIFFFPPKRIPEPNSIIKPRSIASF